MKHGFIKVAAAAPEVRVADTAYNAEQVIKCFAEAKEKHVKLLVFPELCLTGSTCGDLFYHRTLLQGAISALNDVVEATSGVDMLVFVGMPLDVGGSLYSVAAAVYGGDLLGFVPRTDVRGTHFAVPDGKVVEVDVPGLYPVCFATDLLFDCETLPGLLVAAELGSDGDMPVPPAVRHCAAGAVVIASLRSAPMSVYSARDAKREIQTDSRRLCCGFVSAAPGVGESTTDKVYSGLRLAAENGELLAMGEGLAGITVTEFDVEYLLDARRRAGIFSGAGEPHAKLRWGLETEETELTRAYSAAPFLPTEDIDDFCERALDIQAAGLIKRMEYTGCYRPVIGVSGGVDSTLVMLACARALKKMGLPSENLVAVTMPCFGTTARTKSNAITIAEQLGATLRIIPIGDSVLKHFETIGHDYENKNVVFENAQARERTMVLMNIANEVGGLDIGTKDLSEQADGWCTFNGDQISNYDINAGLTKTMVRLVVKYVAAHCEDEVLKAALLDIEATPVTPELLPISESGELIQKSEDSVGPYELQDFFLWHMIIRGSTPEKVLRLAEYAFGAQYDRETLIRWLKSYCRRFFAQQFKRSCSADGPAVMGFTLSPRDGHKMPSDVSPTLWLGEAESL
ncbi:MAG: NAD(+) synthase [Oscillospiraceae bacterium]